MMYATQPAFPATRVQYNRILISALFAGAVAGLIAALLQLVFVQPVLLHAELYESGKLVHFGGAAVSAHPVLPGFNPLRDGLSVLFSALVYVGYAMIVVALMSLAEQNGHVVTAKKGLLWGLAGFITCQFAPGISLAPEVPGAASADLVQRQIWWFGAVVSAGVAMWLLAFKEGLVIYATVAALLLAPHLIGAPEPESFTGPVPPEIGALFAARAFGVGIAAWVILGTCAAHFWVKEGARQPIMA